MIIVAAVQASQIKAIIDGFNQDGSSCNSLNYITDVWQSGLEVRLELLMGNVVAKKSSDYCGTGQLAEFKKD